MKVKALIKAVKKSKTVEFGEKYSDKDIILIDGCFVPISKAREDKRKVDSFYVEMSESGSKFYIDTVYIKEEAAHSIEIEKIEKKKKKDKKKKKG